MASSRPSQSIRSNWSSALWPGNALVGELAGVVAYVVGALGAALVRETLP